MRKSFKLTALMLTVIMALCLTSLFASASTSGFVDFPTGSWSEEAMTAAVSNSLMNGKTQNTIAPKDNITRAEVATIINRAFGAEVKANISRYTDVSSSAWYYTEMQKAVNMETVRGVSDTELMPDAYVTREQVFTILARALVLSDTDETKLTTFADGAKVSLWARSYAAALVNRGYVNGDNLNMLNPQSYITREEFAQVMHNIFKKYVGSASDGINDASYGTTLVREGGLTLRNLTIDGDLIIGDGATSVVLEGVRVSGRILFRGGQDTVTIDRRSSTGKFIVVNNVNGTVPFLNYRDEPIFKRIVENTKATFLKRHTIGGSVFTPETYDVTYDANGGKFAGNASTKKEAGVIGDGIEYVLKTTGDFLPARVGYTFSGWAYDTLGNEKADKIVNATGDKTVYAVWTKNAEVTFVFGSADGDKVTINVIMDKLPVGASSVTNIAFDYDYFKTGTTDATGLVYVDTTSNIGGTLTASDKSIVWEGDLNSIPVGGVLFTITFTKPATEGVVDFEFISSELKNGTAVLEGYDTYPAIIDVQKGQTIIKITYKGTDYFVLKDGYVWDAEDKNGTKLGTVLEAEADKTGYNKVFKNQKGEKIDSATKAGQNMEITFEYEVITYTIQYFDGTNDITSTIAAEKTKYTVETATFALPTLSDTATHTFEGWKDENGNPAAEVAKGSTGKKKFYAVWEEITYDITYNANGGTIDGKTELTLPGEVGVLNDYVLYTASTIPVPLVRDGYTFGGWYLDADCTMGPVTKIAAGSKPDGTAYVYYAKWISDSEAALGFNWEKDDANSKLTVYVTLSELPKDVDALSGITVSYKAIPLFADKTNLTFVSVEGVEATGTADAQFFEFSDGKIAWINMNSAITAAKLKAGDGKLFKITYTYGTPCGDIKFEYDKETKLGYYSNYSYDLIVAKEYTKKYEIVTFDVSYTITIHTQDINDRPEGPVTYIDGTPEVKYDISNKTIDLTTSYEVPEGFVLNAKSVLAGPNNGKLAIEIYLDREAYTVEFNSEIYNFLYGQNLYKGTNGDGEALKKAMDEYTQEKLEDDINVEYSYSDGSAIDYEDDTAFENKVIKITETPKEKTTYTVTLYKGVSNKKGSYDVEAGSYLTQDKVDYYLGKRENYPIEEGYTNSDGEVHEIRANLWYKDGGDWKIYEPAKVAINKDLDVHLLTSYVGAYYNTDLTVKGYKIPEIQIVVPYDSNTELTESGLDLLTAIGTTIESVLYDVENVTGKDLFALALEKASKAGLTDADGNILNPEIVVPLSKLITEELIMKEIDSYINDNINNEDFIADILRNDLVVDVLIGDESIRNTILSDPEKRSKLLTTEAIKRMLSNGTLVDWIVARDNFVSELLESDATFEYIVDDLEALLADTNYHDFIVDACVEFVVDVYFTDPTDENYVNAPELVEYIDEVLNSDALIAEVESNPKLRHLFKAEMHTLLKELSGKPDTDEEKKKIYNEIRTNPIFKQAVIDAVKNDEVIMKPIREEVRADLKKATDDDPQTTSQYATAVIAAVRTEFADTESTLQASIITKIKDDLKKGAQSTLKETVVDAIETDLNKGDQSTLKPIIIQAIKDDIALDTDSDPATSSKFKQTIVDIIVDDVALGDESLYKATIVNTISDDLALGSASEFKPTIVDAIKTDFADPNSELKESIIDSVVADFTAAAPTPEQQNLKANVIATIKTQIGVDDSDLRNLILTEVKTEGSDIQNYVKDYVQNSTALRDEIKVTVKADTAVKNVAKSWLTDTQNLGPVKDEIKASVKTSAAALKVAILESGYVTDDLEAETYANDYVNGVLDGVIYSEINDKLDDFFINDTDVANMLSDNFETIYSAAYDSVFDDMYADDAVFNSAYASYTTDDTKLKDAFDKFRTNGDVDGAIDSFVQNSDNLREAADTYATNNVENAVDLYIDNSSNISEAVGYYVKDSDRVSKALDIYIKNDGRLSSAIDFCMKNAGGLSKAIDLYIEDADDDDIKKAIDIYIASDEYLLRAVNTYISEDSKLVEVFNIFKSNNDNLVKAFDTYIKTDENLNKAFEQIAKADFDKFYNDHFEGADSTLFNTVFEIYYRGHVHKASQMAFDNVDFHDIVMKYVEDYTEELLYDYADGTLAKDNNELSLAIDKLMKEEFPDIIREKYAAPGSTIKTTVDSLVTTKGKELIGKYANNDLKNPALITLIEDTAKDNVDVVVTDYLSGALDADIKKIIDDEIESYTRKLIDDYIKDEGDARETLGELIPTYARTAVDALKDTDAFKNTIKDFTSGRDVRVNEGNIMFISVIADLMDAFDYDKIMKDFAPEKIVKLVNKLNADNIARKYVDGMIDTFVSGVKDAESKLSADIDNEIEGTEYTFSTRIPVRIEYMKDIVEPAYNKAIAKVKTKLLSKEAIAVNPYARKLIEKNWMLEFFDYNASKVSETMTGYSIRKGEYDEDSHTYGSPIMTYYNVFLDNVILLHDAVIWYGDNYEEGTIEEKLDAVSHLVGTYAGKANDVIMEYINTGKLPKGYTPEEIADKILDRVLGVNDKVDKVYEKVEDFYYAHEDKILSAIDKAKNFYAEYLDKDYKDNIDLAKMSIYADGTAYPLYKSVLEMNEDGKALNIDVLSEAIFDSANHLGINKITDVLNKVKGKLARFEYSPVSEIRFFRNAYKASIGPKEIKGRNTGVHTFEAQRFLR